MHEKVAIAFHEKMRQYDLGEGHLFRGDRFANAIRFFESQGLFELPNLVRIEPQSASREDLLRVHDKDYVDSIFRLGKGNLPYDAETPVSKEILEAAMLIIGGAIGCGKSIFEGKTTRAIAIGGGYHHAGRD